MHFVDIPTYKDANIPVAMFEFTYEQNYETLGMRQEWKKKKRRVNATAIISTFVDSKPTSKGRGSISYFLPQDYLVTLTVYCQVFN